jgi:hypothetical protein
MTEPTNAQTMRLQLSEDELLAVEYDLPHFEQGLESQADTERERYDEQIYAALVAPSF